MEVAFGPLPVGTVYMKINNYKLRTNTIWYLLIMIPLLGTLLFNVYPLFKSLHDSFCNMKGVPIGLVNYQIMLLDPDFQQAIINTIYMAVLEVIVNIPLAFILANMLNQIPKARNVYKVIFLFPMIMSMVTVAIMFKYLMMPDDSGVINYILGWFHITPKGFLNDLSMSRESLVAMSIWKGVGYNIIIFFAGLQAIPTEYYEAADIDGANEFRKWWNITVPCMKNTFIFVLITTTIAALKRFTDVYAVSGETGNPAGTLNTIMLYIYKNSFSTYNYKDLGLASAASIILFLLILAFTILNFTVTRERKHGRRK